jgi:hypothetical protein
MNSFKESGLPTLVVGGDPADWLIDLVCDGKPWDGTVRIDGPLPTVTEDEFDWHRGHRAYTRPLRVGDRVMLATDCSSCRQWDLTWKHRQTHGRTKFPCPTCDGSGAVPFATATVAEIKRVDQYPEAESWLVTVTDVEALGQ